jgi:hypothetical protein
MNVPAGTPAVMQYMVPSAAGMMKGPRTGGPIKRRQPGYGLKPDRLTRTEFPLDA